MKKILYILICIAFLGVSLKVNAQGSVTYRITKDNPFDIKNFSAAIDPLWIDCNGQNGFAYGWGLRADHMMGKFLMINVDFRQGFGTLGYDKRNNNTRNYFCFDGGLGLIISHKVKTRNVPIVLSSSSYSSGGYTYTRTLSIKGGVPAKIRTIVAFRGGVNMMGNSVDYNRLDTGSLTLKSRSSGKEYTWKQRDSIPNINAAADAKHSDRIYGAYSATSIYAGFCFRHIRQLIVDVDGWGIRSNKAYNDFYIDGMFAPALLLKDFETPSVTTGTVTVAGEKYDVKYAKKSVIGWRMGWCVRQPKDQGFSFKFEFGMRPGLKAPDNKAAVNFRNWYCMLTYGLYIPLKLKPIVQEE